MENGLPTHGLEDGTLDVERLLVEPQEGYDSMDSVMCFSEKIPKNVMSVEDVSCSFGSADAAISQRSINGEVLDVMPSEVEAGYFRMQSDFCSMGEDYLLGSGAEFDVSFTHLEYGSSEGLRSSVSDCQMQVSNPVSEVAWRSDQFRIMEMPDCSNGQFTLGSSELIDIPTSHESEALVEEKPAPSLRPCTVQNISKFCDSSNSSFEDTFSEEDDIKLPSSGQISCNPDVQENDEFEPTGLDGEPNYHGHEAAETMPGKANSCDVLPTQKRSRKPTKRYIDELSDPIPAYLKKRRSSSTPKDKAVGVRDHKKCHVGSREASIPDEEPSVKAIQVPFGSVVPNEFPNEHGNGGMVQAVDCRDLMIVPKGKRYQKKRDEFVRAVHLKIKDDCSASHKERNMYDIVTSRNRRDGHIMAASPKKRNDFIGTSLKTGDDRSASAVIQQKRDDHIASVSQERRSDYSRAAHQKKRDGFTDESVDEGSVRRKHHRLWTISEVKKLIDGVSQYGVGRWSRIKKLFFSASAHRTSVDLKDKWRNLLKASGIQEQGNQQGERKRNVAWRPLPKSILLRVCELATKYPYPKCQRQSRGHVGCDSPEKSADITLSDYRRILRSINGS